MKRCKIVDILKEYKEELFKYIQNNIAHLPDVKGLNKAMNRSAFDILFYICDSSDNIPCEFHADIKAIGINEQDLIAAYAAPYSDTRIFFMEDRLIIGRLGEIKYSDIDERALSLSGGNIHIVTQQKSGRAQIAIMEAYVNFELFNRCVLSITESHM